MCEPKDLDRAIAGDKEALTTLLERTGLAVRKALAGSIPTRWQALFAVDDVMQQTYTDAFLGIGQFEARGEQAFRAWLTTLAKRNLLDALKMLGAEKRGGKFKRLDPRTTNDSLVMLHDMLQAGSSTPSRRAARTEASAALESAIALLPEKHQQVVRMYDIQGRPVEDVATALQRSPGAVYMLRARAHDRLRGILGTASNYFSTSP